MTRARETSFLLCTVVNLRILRSILMHVQAQARSRSANTLCAFLSSHESPELRGYSGAPSHVARLGRARLLPSLSFLEKARLAGRLARLALPADATFDRASL